MGGCTWSFPTRAIDHHSHHHGANTKSFESPLSIEEKWWRTMRYQETRIGTGHSLPFKREMASKEDIMVTSTWRRERDSTPAVATSDWAVAMESFVFLSEIERIWGDVRMICVHKRERVCMNDLLSRAGHPLGLHPSSQGDYNRES